MDKASQGFPNDRKVLRVEPVEEEGEVLLRIESVNDAFKDVE